MSTPSSPAPSLTASSASDPLCERLKAGGRPPGVERKHVAQQRVTHEEAMTVAREHQTIQAPRLVRIEQR